MIKENGGVANLRTFPYGGHEPQLVGEIIEKPCGISVFNGEQIEEQKGIMAGVPISSFLANYYLKDMDLYFHIYP